MLLLLPAMAILHSLIPASANFLPLPTSQPAIYNRSDGSVYPSWAPIQQVRNAYILKGMETPLAFFFKSKVK
jgi:hypothetical protein